MNAEDRRRASKRGYRQPAGLYRIEGESLTMREISQRLGIGIEAARSRLKVAAKGAGAVTWTKLGAAACAPSRSPALRAQSTVRGGKEVEIDPA